MSNQGSRFGIDHERVVNALSALLRRKNDDCFVIFFDRRTDKYIQFCSFNGNIELDLPSVQLNRLELARAAIYFFTKHGVNPERPNRFDLDDRPLPWDGEVLFHFPVGQNIPAIAQIVFDFFEEICDLPEPLDLLIKEN